MLARLLALLVVCATAASSARAASFCGVAFNFGNGTQARVRLKAYKPTGEGVDARLVCSKWRTICNGSVPSFDNLFRAHDRCELRASARWRYRLLADTSTRCSRRCRLSECELQQQGLFSVSKWSRLPIRRQLTPTSSASAATRSRRDSSI